MLHFLTIEKSEIIKTFPESFEYFVRLQWYGIFLIQEPMSLREVSAHWKEYCFKVERKMKNMLDHSHKKQIVRKLGPNGPFYALMLRTKLY